MRISILTSLPGKTSGGGFQFLKLLKAYLNHRLEYSSSHFKSDILLVNSIQITSPLCFLKAFLFKLIGKRIVHRIAGPISMYRPSDLYLDKSIKCFNQSLVDFTIFQSISSKRANNSIGINPIRNKVILNWRPSPHRQVCEFRNHQNRQLKIVMCSWSANSLKVFLHSNSLLKI